jgi:hypothetical protein
MLKFTRKIKTSREDSTTTKFSVTTSFIVNGLAGLGMFVAYVLQNWPF